MTRPVNDTDRMVITRVFDAPRELVWKAWTDPKYVTQWWGPKGFTAPDCKMDFRVGGKFLWCMKAPDGEVVGWNGGEYFEIGQDPDRDIAFKIILDVRRRSKVSQEVDGYEDFYWRFLFDAGILLCLATFLVKKSTELWWQAAAALVAVALLADAIR